MQLIQKLLLGIYDLVQKTGLLNQGWFKRLFWVTYFLYKRYFEDPFFRLTQNYSQLFEGGNILDIGANIGYTATVFAKVISPGFQVYAFEPDGQNFLSLREIIKIQRQLGKVIPIRAAVGQSKGTIQLWHNDSHHADHRIVTEEYEQRGVDFANVSTVPLWSIDSFVSSELENAAVQFIKIDVQGYEFPVCLGMTETLAANPRAIIVLEYMPHSMLELGFNPSDIFQFFQEKGYLMYIVHQKSQLERVDRETVDQFAEKRDYVDLLFSKQEIN